VLSARLEAENWLVPGLAAMMAVVVGVIAGIDPKFAIAAALALAFVVLVLADLVAGLVVFTFLAFLEIVPFGGPALSVTKLLGLLLAISWLAVIGARRTLAFDRAVLRPIMFLLAGLLAWILLSATWAENPGAAVETLARYGLNAILFAIVATSVRDRETAMWLLGAFVAGATVAALYGIASPSQFEAEYGRLTSATLDPNELAAVLVPASILCMFAALGLPRAPLARLGALGIGLLCGATILLTVSRGGLIALAIALVAAIIVGGRWRAAIAAIAAVTAVATFIYFAAFASPEVVDHLRATTQGDERVQEGRVTIWQVALRMSGDHPTTGVGAGNFADRSPEYVLEPGQTPRTDLILEQHAVVHNTYLETLAELGVIGLALYAALIGLCVAALVRAAAVFKASRDVTMELLARGLIAGLIGLLAADFFISDQFSKALWLLLALGPAMLMLARRQAGAQQPPLPAR
jgi:O-antigen ligase